MAQSGQQTVDDYLRSLSQDRKSAISNVRDKILHSLPAGYEETIQHGMISYVIPLETYPVTYNNKPLVFAALASQKNYMTVHLMNIYGNREDEAWFMERYKATGMKINMGKGCVRFKKIDDLPVELIGEAIARTPVDAFIQMYESIKGKP
ncbi:MAG: DUF1801 domain-containing protein [Chloroflexi bacterium]|nr:DUF1801 domain-containing protein [Chloroflexota bacterium]